MKICHVLKSNKQYLGPLLNYFRSPLLENSETDFIKSDNGLFNVTTLITFKDETIEDPTDFICSLYIPDAHYTEEVLLKYYPGKTIDI